MKVISVQDDRHFIKDVPILDPTALVDQDYIELYVDNDTGDDSNVGTQDQPLKELNEAIIRSNVIASATKGLKRTYILLKKGSYSEVSAVSCSSEIFIEDHPDSTGGVDISGLYAVQSKISFSTTGDLSFSSSVNLQNSYIDITQSTVSFNGDLSSYNSRLHIEEVLIDDSTASFSVYNSSIFVDTWDYSERTSVDKFIYLNNSYFEASDPVIASYISFSDDSLSYYNSEPDNEVIVAISKESNSTFNTSSMKSIDLISPYAKTPTHIGGAFFRTSLEDISLDVGQILQLDRADVIDGSYEYLLSSYSGKVEIGDNKMPIPNPLIAVFYQADKLIINNGSGVLVNIPYLNLIWTLNDGNI